MGGGGLVAKQDCIFGGNYHGGALELSEEGFGRKLIFAVAEILVQILHTGGR